MRVSAAGVEVARPLARKPRLRAVTVSGGAEVVRVAARTGTRIRFDTALDAGRTRLHEARGRFEPLVVGCGFLVIIPREELAAGERVKLQVVLADGTELPFVLAANPAEVDVQLRVRRAPVMGAPTVVSTAWRERVRGLRARSAEWPARRGSAEGWAGRLAGVFLEVSPEACHPEWLVIITGAVSPDASDRFEPRASPPEGIAL
jgi:Protein of unknown function (DUF2381)